MFNQTSDDGIMSGEITTLRENSFRFQPVRNEFKGADGNESRGSDENNCLEALKQTNKKKTSLLLGLYCIIIIPLKVS